MIIPSDFRIDSILQHHERLWRNLRPSFTWPDFRPYTAEYSWACDRLATHIKVPHKEARVMDAGGGSSSMQHFLAENYGECFNVDVKPGKLHLDCKPATLIKSDLEYISELENSSFDGILSLSAIEHNPWEKIIAIVRNLLNLLKPEAPLVATMPASKKAHYYTRGSWPEPHQAKWPECYCFDADSFRELFAEVKDLATPAEPSKIPNTETYQESWQVMYDNFPQKSTYPYLSTGFVLIRR